MQCCVWQCWFYSAFHWSPQTRTTGSNFTSHSNVFLQDPFHTTFNNSVISTIKIAAHFMLSPVSPAWISSGIQQCQCRAHPLPGSEPFRPHCGCRFFIWLHCSARCTHWTCSEGLASSWGRYPPNEGIVRVTMWSCALHKYTPPPQSSSSDSSVNSLNILNTLGSSKLVKGLSWTPCWYEILIWIQT